MLELPCLKELLIRKSRISAVTISGRAGQFTPASWSDASVTQLIRFSRELVLRRGPAHHVSVRFGSTNPGRHDGMNPMHPAQDAADPPGQPAHQMPAMFVDEDDPPPEGGAEVPDPPDDMEDDPPAGELDPPAGELDPPGAQLAEMDVVPPTAAVIEDLASGSGTSGGGAVEEDDPPLNPLQ